MDKFPRFMKNKNKQALATADKGQFDLPKNQTWPIPPVKEPKQPSVNDGGYIWVV
jgi:hypothetical protein